MSQSAKNHGTGCPVAFALDIFGDRWSLLVIRDLMLRGNETYGEFLDSGEGIATNVLADRLKGLEAEGIIVKSPDPDNRRRNIYRLTQKGLDLAPVIMEMIRWGGKHDNSPGARKENAARIDKNSAGFLHDLRARLTQGIQ